MRHLSASPFCYFYFSSCSHVSDLSSDLLKSPRQICPSAVPVYQPSGARVRSFSSRTRSPFISFGGVTPLGCGPVLPYSHAPKLHANDICMQSDVIRSAPVNDSYRPFRLMSPGHQPLVTPSTSPLPACSAMKMRRKRHSGISPRALRVFEQKKKLGIRACLAQVLRPKSGAMTNHRRRL